MHPQLFEKIKIINKAHALGVCLPLSLQEFLNESLDRIESLFYSLKSTFIKTASFSSLKDRKTLWNDKTHLFWNCVKQNEEDVRRKFPHFERIASLLEVTTSELYRALIQEGKTQGDNSKKQALRELYFETLKSEQKGAAE